MAEPEKVEGRPGEKAAPSRTAAVTSQHNLFQPAALACARRGWFVFPCRPNAKEPLWGCLWKQEATCDPERLLQWWGAWPTANIGIALGHSFLAVVDVDDPTRFKATGFQLPRTLTSRTARGGHFYYRSDQELRTHYGDGYEVKGGAGAYVIAPPSLHPTGARYSWIDPNAPLSPLPVWAAEKAAPKPYPEGQWSVEAEFNPSPRTSRYGRIVLLSECKALAAMAPNTGRNNKLNKVAFRIGQLCVEGKIGVVDGCLDPETAEMLWDAALTCGLDLEEFQRTAPHAFEDGQRSPRDRSG